MRRLLFMLAAALLLTGCATKPFDLGELNTTPVQGAIVPKYAPSSGVLVLGEGLGLKRAVPSEGALKVIYASQPAGDNLLWMLTFVTPKASYSASIKTTRAGAVLSTVIIGKDGPLPGGGKLQEVVLATTKLFSSFFLPLSETSVAQGGVISQQPPLFLDTDSKEPSPKDAGTTILSGEAVYEGIPCYVLKHHEAKDTTVKATREVMRVSTDAYLLVDRDTMLPVFGEMKIRVGVDSSLFPGITRIRRIKAEAQ